MSSTTSSATAQNIQLIQILATELKVRAGQIEAAISLLDSGSTVPFIARYRKEATGGLDDIVLRALETRLLYLRELQARRQSILASIESQGKLSAELRSAIEATQSKTELEDLYAPFKPKRVTKAQLAKQAGLEPLAEQLLADPKLDPNTLAAQFLNVDAGFADVAAVLQGATDILAERWAEDASLLGMMREWLWSQALLTSKVLTGKEHEGAKFRDYFDYSEPIHKVPSHRALALLRGAAAQILDVKLEPPASAEKVSLAEQRMAQHLSWLHQGRAADDWLQKTIRWCWRVKLSLAIERDLLQRMREQAEAVAMRVFGDNLRDLLLAAPASDRVVMGLDPGIRTGVKVAVVDRTGKLLDTATVFPHEPRNDWQGALASLKQLCAKHDVDLICIGNGTASRETDALAAELMEQLSAHKKLHKLVVSEAGASVYSASELASQEMPDVDVSLRGAVSIARRVQDPLAELVKIDPKSIGVGQYQHDVNQNELARSLDAVVEDCVNRVGVDVNTASSALLARVAGLNTLVARNIVRHREQVGAFASREQLKQVSGFGLKTFEQAAGFLRVRGGVNQLDQSAVHPEAYPLVERILEKTGKNFAQLMGAADVLSKLKPETLIDERFGMFTVIDVLKELEKPGRDPRPSFKVAELDANVRDIRQLKAGMTLQGTVTNVAAFGAFIDIGVHQDGLVHVSELADRYVSDAREVVKTGAIVNVRVLEVDLERGRISLSMRSPKPGEIASASGSPAKPGQGGRGQAAHGKTHPAPAANALAQAFSRAGLRK